MNLIRLKSSIGLYKGHHIIKVDGVVCNGDFDESEEPSVVIGRGASFNKFTLEAAVSCTPSPHPEQLSANILHPIDVLQNYDYWIWVYPNTFVIGLHISTATR